jgi:putative addiction module component (TIGR02574 family)
MTRAARDLLEEALKLDVSERADLAAELLASLDGEPEEQVEAAWAAEIQRRIDRIEAGTEKLLPWEDVQRQIDKEILGR